MGPGLFLSDGNSLLRHDSPKWRTTVFSKTGNLFESSLVRHKWYPEPTLGLDTIEVHSGSCQGRYQRYFHQYSE